MKRKRILFIQNSLMQYRLPLYRYLHSNYGDITICHSSVKMLSDNDVINEIVLNTVSIGSFHFQKKLLKLTTKFDIIIGMFDLHWPLIWSLPLFLRKHQRFFLWGIGVSTSDGLDVNRKMDFIRFPIAKLADGLLFYTSYPLNRYMNRGFDSDKLFVCNNTVMCERKIDLKERKFEKILFFGRLTAVKRVDILIDAFSILKKKINTTVFLEIVGDGPEKKKLEEYVEQKNLQESVVFSGAVYDIDKKPEIFQNSICTVSPNQAGLSVLESFAYGVPFVTSPHAITGGEIFNIAHSLTGFLVEGSDNLADLFMILINNKDLVREISENCFDHYWNKRQIKHMANGFIEAFESR